MFENYSQTYASAILTFAPLVVIILGRFGLEIAQSDVILIGGSIISAIGFIWQLVNRFKQGGVTPLGRKI